MPWRPIPLSYGIAIYPFQPGPSTAELPLQIGDQLYVVEQGGSHGDWFRGYLVAPPSLLSALKLEGRCVPGADARVFSGIFPKCCVEIREELGGNLSRPGTSNSSQNSREKPPAPVPMLKIGDETTLSSEPLVDEISSCLREWYLLQLPELILDRQYDLFEKTSGFVTKLEHARRQLLYEVLTEYEKVLLRIDAVMNLVRVSKLLSGEVIVRDAAGRLLTGEDSAIEISKKTVAGVLVDITEADKSISGEELNGHSQEGQDGRISSLGRNGTITLGRSETPPGRSSRLSRRLSKMSISNGRTHSATSTTGLDPSLKISNVQEEPPDEILKSLLNWRYISTAKVLDMLPQVMFVPEQQLVERLEDVFDSLFEILVHNACDSKIEDLIFNDLVRIFGITNDRRFDIEGLVDQYMEEQFESPLAAPCLLRSLTRLLQSVSDPQSARDLRALFKVGRHIVRLVVTSHQQSKLHSANSDLLANHRTFKEDMQAILFGLQMMMRSETAALIGSKTLLVQHFHSWLPELLPAFTTDEVIRIAVNFVESCQDAKGRLILHRLIMIRNYARLDELWVEPQDQLILLKNCLRWLLPYWGHNNEATDLWRQQVRLCAAVVAELLTYRLPAIYDFMPTIIDTYSSVLATSPSSQKSLSHLYPDTYPFASKPVTVGDYADEALLELGALVSGICRLPPPPAINLQNHNLCSYALALLDSQNSMLDGDAFPENWLSLSVYYRRSTLTVLEHITSILLQNFLPAPEFAERFDMDTWKAFFATLLKLVCSDILALENFSEQKRRVVWKIGGDIREGGANLLKRTWQAIGWESSTDDERRYNLKRLGGYQVQYVPSLVPSIVQLCLSMHEGIRRAAVEILQTMIISEWALSEDLGLIETEVVASLDVLLRDRTRINEATNKLFINELRDLFATIAEQPDDALWTAIEEFLAVVEELVALLTARTSAPEDDGALHTLRLTEFMQSMRNEDIFIRYIHELSKEYESRDMPTEAAMALQRHATLYNWDPHSRVHALQAPNFPEQSAFERKESLYLAMIQRLEEGHAWTDAMKCYKELAEHYENTTMEFGKLARAQRAMAHINEERAVSRTGSVSKNVNGDLPMG